MKTPRLSLFTACALTAAVAATGARPQPQATAPVQSTDAARCAALAANPALENIPGAPTRITGARLIDVPGVHHCAGGPGLTDFDPLTLLENWVEKGQPPDVMIASRSVNGVTERTRPIYPYPMLARYSGQGDPRQAASYVSFDPAAARK